MRTFGYRLGVAITLVTGLMVFSDVVWAFIPGAVGLALIIWNYDH